MIRGLEIRLMRNGEERAASELVEKVFNEFVGPGYTAEGIKTFLDYIRPEAMAERLLMEGHFTLVAFWKGSPAGVLSVRDFNHISLLFVDKSYQGKGISRELFRKATGMIKKDFHHIKEILVNSSPYALAVYKKLGFQSIDSEKEKNGIRYIPMIFKL